MTIYETFQKGSNIPPDFKFPLSVNGNKNRSFQRSWLERYPGLVYDVEEDGVYCIDCVLFEPEPEKRGKLVNAPFKNWKKALEIFDEHFFGKSSTNKKRGGSGYDRHMTCCTKADHFKSSMKKDTNVYLMMNSALEDRKLKNMAVLESVVKTILLCGKQNIALRGHRDDSQHIENSSVDNVGNFQALLDFRIDSGDVTLNEHFKTAPKNATYRSKSVQNEIINIIGDLLREKIVKDVKKSGEWFAVSADEVRDVSNKEQLAVCIRFVDETGNYMHNSKSNFMEIVLWVKQTYIEIQ